ncbi:sensor histidine kinase [Arcobacter roscoffensis]|uniref:histidine kinase n=1 Tax=Arcobacter roscoffensis TaxID=2961520 RepID=A0ABY5E4Y6_9BACT|nr:cache domain-containing protein [Arcobacter roscoffensis]UTJ05840.1 cache domain-containing protein [Arcobacter roscoffensis]
MLKTERDIVNLIKYLPVILIIFFSFLITIFLYGENQSRFESELKNLEEKYIQKNKDEIEFQVKKVIETVSYEKKLSKKRLRNDIKVQVNNAYSIALSIYENNQDKTKEEIKKLIKDSLRNIRFNENRGYLFIYEMSGVNILHPLKPHLENKNLWNYQDKKGTYLLQEMNKILKKQDSTYYTWYWNKPNDLEKEYEKLGYFKKFEPFDWFIGTGEYVYDSQEQLKKDVAQSITNLRYKKNGYFFALTFEGEYVSYYLEDLIGKNVKDLNITDDITTTQNKMIELAKKDGGFISYSHNQKPNSISSVTKISYVNGLKNWEWIIGTGFYMDDLYEEINEKKELLKKANNKSLMKLVVVSLFITIILLVIFIYISSILESKFESYKKEIKRKVDESIKKDNILAHQSKMASMGEMLGNIAHQWRQPLSIISTMVTGLKVKRELGEQDLELEKNSYDKINRQIQYLSKTIDDFRDFFKPQKDYEKFYIDETFVKTFDLVEAQLESKYINLIKDIDSVEINSLENELIQVFINIINNSKDELLKLNTKRFIKIDCKNKEDYLEITFIDNAGGIDISIIDSVFEAYFTTKDDDQGTGIGLFMCKEIIIKHLNGKMYVENSEFNIDDINYKGAKFTIILPIIDSKTNEDLS